ncbi:hypothetical protein GUJ93_ZPchr0009g464 [Zizania palustris]|uniref:Uncharacterized protein n=1 Tax=Zizania palustris TaxID=103762 RepID=A0A8J5V2G9_ZIZPA|nr:hypothetical protein GUJ93_ZPchr0009g464 [Zizania palustris]
MATDSARCFAPTAADSAPTATDPSRHRRPPLRPDYRRAAPICIPRAAAPASRCFRRILAGEHPSGFQQQFGGFS